MIISLYPTCTCGIIVNYLYCLLNFVTLPLWNSFAKGFIIPRGLHMASETIAKRKQAISSFAAIFFLEITNKMERKLKRIQPLIHLPKFLVDGLPSIIVQRQSRGASGLCGWKNKYNLSLFHYSSTKRAFFHFFFLLNFFYPYSIIPPQPFSLLVRTPAEGYLPVPSHRNVEETWTEYKQRPTSWDDGTKFREIKPYLRSRLYLGQDKV